MPWFEYEGLTPGGTAIAGRVEAPNREDATDSLYQMQIEVRELRSASPPPARAAAIGEQDLVFFNEQLASLADAGMALDEGLAQLARDVESPRLRKWIDRLVEDLKRGVPLDQAIEANERGLPVLYSQVIRAGIQSGELSGTLLNLNQHLQLRGKTRQLLWETLSYPMIVALATLILMTGIFTLVVPKFREIFADFGTVLPGLTLFLLEAAAAWPSILAIGGGVIGMCLLIWHLMRYSKGGHGIRERVTLGVPAIGRVYRASLIARFLRAVSTAVATGIPLPEAVRLGAGATGSVLLTRDAEYLASEVEAGQSIFVANQSARLIPPLFGFAVQVASSREVLPQAIAQLAASYENRAIYNHNLLRSVFYPVAVLLLGGCVGFIVTALFLPLVTLINAVSG
jgi:type II secretory pathway component PulF